MSHPVNQTMHAALANNAVCTTCGLHPRVLVLLNNVPVGLCQAAVTGLPNDPEGGVVVRIAWEKGMSMDDLRLEVLRGEVKIHYMEGAKEGL